MGQAVKKISDVNIVSSQVVNDVNLVSSQVINDVKIVDKELSAENRLLFETFPLLDKLILDSDTFDSYILRRDKDSLFVTAHFFVQGVQQFRLVQGYDVQEDVGASRLPASSTITDLLFSQGDNPALQPTGEIVGALFAIGGTDVVFSIIQDLENNFLLVGNVLLTNKVLPEGEYKIVVNVTDASGTNLNKSVTVVINDESLITNIFLSNIEVSLADAFIGSTVGVFSTLGGQKPITYTLLDQRATDQNGNPIDLFEITGDNLKIKNNITDPVGTVYYIFVEAEDNRTDLPDEDRERLQDFFLLTVSNAYQNEFQLSFNGIDQRVEVADDPTIKLTEDFSISFWFKVDEFVGTQVICSKYEQASKNRSFSVLVTDATLNEDLRVLLYDSNGDIGKNYKTNFSLNAGQRYHLFFTFTNDDLRIYLDGVELTVLAGTLAIEVDNTLTSMKKSTAPLIWGCRIGNGSARELFFKGSIDEGVYWNDVIPQAGVTATYNNGIPANLTSNPYYTSVVSWWRFGEGRVDPNILIDEQDVNEGTGFNFVDGDYLPFSISDLKTRFVSNQVVDWGNPNALRLTDNISFFAWIEADLGARTTIMSHWAGGATNQKGWIFRTNSDGTLSFVASGDGINIDIFATSEETVLTATRALVGFTYSSGTLKMYINTALTSDDYTTLNPITTLHDSTASFNMGAFDNGIGGYNDYFLGTIDEASMWDSVLDENHINELYGNGAPEDLSQHSSKANLIFWARMGEGRPNDTTFVDEKNNATGTGINITASNYEAY